jgi:hypothetical protein
MKKLQIIIAILGIAIFSMQPTYAQKDAKAKEIVYKTSVKEMPQKVKEALQDYAGYKISEKATFTKKSKGQVYKVKITKGIWEYYLLIHESGKIMGIETGENSDA